VDDASVTTQALKRALELHPRSIDLSLDRIQRLLGEIGNPEAKLPRPVLIAGTNGKGSVVAIMRAILEAAGFRVHVYTSPHLVHFRERIRIAGKLITDKALGALLEECEAANAGKEITFFEFTTAAAMLAFAREPADVSLIEVGLGGRFDATNVVTPVATAITPIGLDHQHFLGNSIAKIAAEKAGILKRGVPAVIGPQVTAALEVIQQAAEKIGAPILSFNREWSARRSARDPARMDYSFGSERQDLPAPALAGRHQIHNAGIALTLLQQLGALEIPEPALRAGLDWVQWPARLQRLDGNEISSLLPDKSEVWLDGFHNPQAAKSIARFMASRLAEERPFYFICGVLEGKDAAGILKCFRAMTDEVFAVGIPGAESALPAGRLAAEASAAGFRGRPMKDVLSAVRKIGDVADPDNPPVILIGGSLYLAGAVLKRLKYVPK